jgi:hypothetical protein
MSKKLFCIFAAIFCVCFLGACSEERVEPNPFGVATWKGNDLEPRSSHAAIAGHAVRSGAATVGRQIAFTVGIAMIAIMPWIVIFLIPGIWFGRWEMKVESLSILCTSGIIWYFGSAFHDLGLIWWLVWLNVIPAVILMFWSSESGKIALFGFFAGFGAAYMIVKSVNMLLSGLVLQPLTTIVVCVIVFFVFRLFHEREGGATA